MQNPRFKSWDYDKLIEKKSKIITKPILKKKKLIQNDKIIKENEQKKEDVERHYLFKLETRIIWSEALQMENKKS
jgi:hypothetical protein